MEMNPYKSLSMVQIWDEIKPRRVFHGNVYDYFAVSRAHCCCSDSVQLVTADGPLTTLPVSPTQEGVMF